jgi:PAS domain S-box-containing protein
MTSKSWCIAMIAAMCLGYPVAATAKRDSNTKINLLHLNSYEYGYQWSDTILDGIKSVVTQSGLNISLHIEYMDTKLHYDQNVKMHLYHIYAHKYRNVTFDIIIVSDNNAFDFYRQFHADLFPGVPAIFCGVNDFSPKFIKNMDHVTGIVESFDIKENLKLALKFHPGRKRIVVVEDNSTTAQAIKRQIQQAFNEMAVTPQHEYIKAGTLEDLTATARTKAKDSIFYIIPFYMDDQKGRITAREVINAVWQSTGAPLYSNWKFMVGSGVVGGKVIDGFKHGAAAASMAISVLEGKHPKDIPIIKPNDELFIFDNNIMDKFNIDSNSLPSGSTILNRTAYFFEVDRQLFWLLMGGAVLATIALVFLLFNISQRKDAESRLKDQLTFVRQLINTIPIPIYFRNESGKFTGVNLSFEKWFNIEREEIIGTDAGQMKSRSLGQLVDQADTDLLADIGIKIYEKRIHLDGRGTRSVILHKASYTNTKAEIAGIVGAIHDITNRKITEEELRESQQMLQSVLDNIPQHVHWKDQDLKYIGANRSFGSFYGLQDLKAVTGKTDMDLISDKAVAALSMQTDRKVVENNKGAYHMRWTVQRHKNDRVWLKVNRVPLHDHTGKVVGVLSTAEDITQTIKLQNKLVETTKMEAIGTLAGGIAHDFNNILTSIINSTELAIEDVPTETMTAADLRRSLKAARRGSRLVKQILTFSRADKEGFQPTSIADVVEEAAHLLEASLPGNIQIKTHISKKTAVCQADPTQIHQVVMNLCTNAFQALEGTGGTLSIRLQQTDVPKDVAEALDIKPGLYLELAISDDGPGIPFGIQDKIFDPFFTTKQQGEGTGLGLAVVHGIVRGHNGAVRVISRPRKTQFKVFLPLITASPHSPAEKDHEIAGGDETILFVEDDEDQLQLIPRVLTQLGYRVVACPDGKAAYEALEKHDHRWDLLITDYDMPEMTGLQLAEKVARTHPCVPVIIVTGRKAPEGMGARSPNIKKLIRKPYHKKSISIAIREVLGQVEVPLV